SSATTALPLASWTPIPEVASSSGALAFFSSSAALVPAAIARAPPSAGARGSEPSCSAVSSYRGAPSCTAPSGGAAAQPRTKSDSATSLTVRDDTQPRRTRSREMRLGTIGTYARESEPPRRDLAVGSPADAAPRHRPLRRHRAPARDLRRGARARLRGHP